MEDIINDEVFGELKYQAFAWVKRMDTPFLNSKGNLVLGIHDPNKEGILDVQRETYKTYLQNEEKYKSCVTELLLNYYKWNYEYIESNVSGVDENDHKDVVTDKELYQFMTLWYLFICRDGSFGYAFGCCWDVDNGLAVLLSEDEPRVISRTQLENLHKLNDPTVGLLVHDGKNTWKGLEINSFFGKPENLEIELEGGVDEGITEAQQKAYTEYLAHKEVFFTKYLEPSKSQLLPKTLYIDREGNYLWKCTKTTWYQLSEIPLAYGEIHDDDFGELVYTGKKRWEGRITANFNGKETALAIELEGTKDGKMTDAQRKAYAEYKEKEGDFFKAVEDKAKEVYNYSTPIYPKVLFIDRQGNYGWMGGSKTIILSDGDVQFAASINILYNYADVIATRTKTEWYEWDTIYLNLLGELDSYSVERDEYKVDDYEDEEIRNGKLTEQEVDLLLWLTNEYDTSHIADEVLEYCNAHYENSCYYDEDKDNYVDYELIEKTDLFKEVSLSTVRLMTKLAEETCSPDIAITGECECDPDHGIAICFCEKAYDGICSEADVL